MELHYLLLSLRTGFRSFVICLTRWLGENTPGLSFWAIVISGFLFELFGLRHPFFSACLIGAMTFLILGDFYLETASKRDWEFPDSWRHGGSMISTILSMIFFGMLMMIQQVPMEVWSIWFCALYTSLIVFLIYLNKTINS